MTRINDRLLVQMPDREVIVIMDESSGEEITFHPRHVPALTDALRYFWDCATGDQS